MKKKIENGIAAYSFVYGIALFHDGRAMCRSLRGVSIEGHIGLYSNCKPSTSCVLECATTLLGSDEFPILKENQITISDNCVSLTLSQLSELTGGITKEGEPSRLDGYGRPYEEVDFCLNPLERPVNNIVPLGNEIECAKVGLSLFVASINALRKWRGLERVLVRIPPEANLYRYGAVTRLGNYARISTYFADDTVTVNRLEPENVSAHNDTALQ